MQCRGKGVNECNDAFTTIVCAHTTGPWATGTREQTRETERPDRHKKPGERVREGWGWLRSARTNIPRMRTEAGSVPTPAHSQMANKRGERQKRGRCWAFVRSVGELCVSFLSARKVCHVCVGHDNGNWQGQRERNPTVTHAPRSAREGEAQSTDQKRRLAAERCQSTLRFVVMLCVYQLPVCFHGVWGCGLVPQQRSGRLSGQFGESTSPKNFQKRQLSWLGKSA